MTETEPREQELTGGEECRKRKDLSRAFGFETDGLHGREIEMRESRRRPCDACLKEPIMMLLAKGRAHMSACGQTSTIIFSFLFSLSSRLLFVFSDDGDQLFEGLDCEAKEKIARELAKLVFGSQESFVSICLSSFSLKDLWNKRSRDEDINWFPFVEDLSQSW
ncbi:hypothetical protein F2Q69_00061336 [Brassica cretica]|uniref:Uncharacterized protein n=1 Tax=Brassica cretica TaxID=69181 RepID=A0A8S9RCX2_BRACR|nr:hypothetical protein F2Q69_00061336 [Brassica cretica]